MKYRIMGTIVGLLGFMLSTQQAAAAVQPLSATLSVQGGYYIFSQDEQTINSSAVAGMSLGFNLTEHLGLEGVAMYMPTTTDTTPSIDISAVQLRLDFLYHFNPQGPFVPYLAIGGGSNIITPENLASDTSFAGAYGVGVKYYLSDAVALRFDVRHILDYNSEDLTRSHDVVNNLAVTGGLMMQAGFGAPGTRPADGDGDGILDALDRCADTPAGTVVDSDGCPLPKKADADDDGVADAIDRCPDTPRGVAVNMVGCPLPKETDEDGDGVIDGVDRCAGTPKGTAVDASGCPKKLDSDGDGILDENDKCPGTPKGTPVNQSGCPLPKTTDEDGDGIPDANDRCPATPKGTAVDAVGCPLPKKADADNDGVLDGDDKCPGTPAGTTVDVAGCPLQQKLDSDGDGVLDTLDKCPATVAGTAVDATGCPLPKKVDSDNDGIDDTLDRCPGTPVGVPVNSLGCPADSDGDGIFDVEDRCPGTAIGVVVDDNGCPLPAPVAPAPKAVAAPREELVLRLEFKSGDATILAKSADDLAKAADYLGRNKDRSFIIEGHTDSNGADAANMTLSQKRADSVKEYLVKKHGVDPKRLEARGMGETRPIGDNATQEGRALNRRVVITPKP